MVVSTSNMPFAAKMKNAGINSINTLDIVVNTSTSSTKYPAIAMAKLT